MQVEQHDGDPGLNGMQGGVEAALGVGHQVVDIVINIEQQGGYARMQSEPVRGHIIWCMIDETCRKEPPGLSGQHCSVYR